MYLFRPEFLNVRIFTKIYLYSPNFYELCCFFTAGALLTLVDLNKIKYKNVIICSSIIILIITIFTNTFNILKFLLLPIIMILFGVQSTPVINKTGDKLGDMSYGIYIYGWFIQQIIILLVTTNVFLVITISSIFSILFAYASWHFIEKKALNYKNFIK